MLKLIVACLKIALRNENYNRYICVYNLLKRCTWLRNPPDMPLVHHVGLRAPDDSILENLSRSKETTISYPCTIFLGLKAGETVELEGQRYQVREIRAVGDGTELRTKLTRL